MARRNGSSSTRGREDRAIARALADAAQATRGYRDQSSDARMRIALEPTCRPSSNFPGTDARKPKATERVSAWSFDDGRDRGWTGAPAGEPTITAATLVKYGTVVLDARRARMAKRAAAAVDAATAAVDSGGRNLTRACESCFINLPTGTDVCDYCGDAVSARPTVAATAADDYLLADA